MKVILQTVEVKTKIRTIENEIDVNSVNENVNRLTEVLTTSLPDFPTSNKRKSKSKCSHKKWYDSDCRILRRTVNNASRQLSKSPWDVKLRENFFALRKQYKKLLNYKSKKFKEDLVRKINDSSSQDSKHFWEIVDELKSLKSKICSRNVSQLIPCNVWYDHFNKLLAKKETIEEVKCSDDLRMNIENIESEQGGAYLNEDISSEEVSKALRSLKNGKSCGLDSVSNEMLKASRVICLDVYCKLFNMILKSGEFPEIWTRSFIVPLHKSGNCHDPNYYRGLAINSCFGKLFTTILNNRLKKFINNNNVIHRHQIGFTEKSQTIDHMLVIKTLVDK